MVPLSNFGIYVRGKKIMTSYFGAHITNCNNLHPDNKNWQAFFDVRCKLEENHKDWLLYSDRSNGFYIVTPSGTVKPPVHGLGIWHKWEKLKTEINRV